MTELATRGSALPAVQSRQDLEALSDADLWTFAERATEAGQIAWEVADERLRRWVEVEEKTQTEIAQLIGRGQKTVSERCERLGIKPASNRGRPRISGATNSEPDDAEVVDAEVVEESSDYVAPSEPSYGTPDPGPRVKCPTCGHMVVPTDIQTWKE